MPDPTDDSGRPADAGDRLRGAAAGLFATTLMTAYRMSVARSPPPPASSLALVLGGSHDDHVLGGLLLHALYGTTAGVGYARSSEGTRSARSSAFGVRDAAAGAAYGAVLSVVGDRVVVPLLTDLDLDADDRALFHVGHLVYGTALGTWLGGRG
jgi:hypothetical protein